MCKLSILQQKEILASLKAYAEILECWEAEGKLATNLPIENTKHTSYGAKQRDLIMQFEAAMASVKA